MLKLIGTLSFIWLFIAIAVAQPSDDSPPAVLDTDGEPIRSGLEYYILPDTNQTGGDNGGGGLTLVNRNGSCPFFAGQEDLANSTGLPVIFTPFLDGDTIVRESRDFTVYFSAATICIQSTAWKLGETDSATNRTLIVTGRPVGNGFGSYFRISRNGDGYELVWCPTDLCPICRFICGTLDILVKDGKRLLALYGPAALRVVFKKA